MKKRNYLRFHNLFIALLFVVLCVAVYLLFISFDSGIATAITGTFATIFIAIWTNYSAKKLEINSYHFSEKKEHYADFIKIIFDLHRGNMIDDADLQNRVLNFKQALMVWGSAKMILALEEYEKTAQCNSSDDTKKILLRADKLLRAIRNDLGHQDYLLEHGSLVGMLLDAESKNIFSKK